MCGIAGIVNTNQNSIDPKELQLMTDSVAHRGPDGEGHFIDNHVALGHRRLAIIDLSKDGHQPMQKEDLVLTYNGEIYNYIELREELQSYGHKFNTKTDSEVILTSYLQWGPGCVEKFNGMWAFAIFDSRENRLFLSRDRFGIKPLYYYQGTSKIVFGSEIKQFLPLIPERKVDRQSLYDFLFLSYQDHTERTFFKNIMSLPAGHSMVIDAKSGGLQISRYYELKKRVLSPNLTLDEVIEEYKNAFDKSIDLRLRSDVKVGTCLSGGLDSSYVAKVASKKYKGLDRFTAVTAKSIDAANDESKYAARVVDSCGLDGKITQPTKEDFIGMLDDIIYNQEEPFATPSIFMQYFVMKSARDAGCVVMLDGQGGDETLLGYERYFVPYLRQIKNPIRFMKEFFSIVKNSKLTFGQLTSYFLYFGFSGIKKKKILHRSRYILKENHKYLDNELTKVFDKASSDIFELQKLELSQLQLPKLLKFEDRNSMAHSVEARVPFVDHELIELAVTIPVEYKIKDGWSKFILRKCFDEEALQVIAWRKEKLGFEAPTKKWMKDLEPFKTVIMGSKFLDSVIDKNYPLDNLEMNAIWKLYNVAKWADTFDVKY